MLQLLSNVSARLSYMHEAGFVHRDLKPANVMWLPRENRWTIIDFGCAARIGTPAPLSFTLAYAAPEVVRAFEMGKDRIESNPALDAWSLGVMAFELLTGLPAFRLVTDGRARVRSDSTVSLAPQLMAISFTCECVQRVHAHKQVCRVWM
jgi:serine/threonine protein kinase